jgi:hypothetical protein
MEPKMNIAVRVDQGGVPAKSPSESSGRTRCISRSLVDRAERNETVMVTELPVWCIEA